MHERSKATSDMPAINKLVSDQLTTRVLVIGAGPVGLTLAMDLATRGIRVDRRGDTLRGRTAEREMQPRLVTLDGDFPATRTRAMSCATPDCPPTIRTTAPTAPRRPASSCRASRFPAAATATPRRADPTPSGRRRAAASHQPDPHGAGAVRARRRHRRASRILNRTAFEDFSEDNDGIVAPSATSTPASEFAIRADFIVGCDGARSLVRKAIDANLQGTPIIQRVQSTYIHAPALLALMDGRPG